MARYKVGDRIRFFNPRTMIGPRDGEIIEVIQDVTDGDSNYMVLCDARGGIRRRYTALDRNIIIPLPQPTVQAPIEVIPVPEEDQEEETTEAPAQRPGIAGQMFAQPFNLDWGAVGNQLWGRTRHDEIKDEARENIANYRAIGFDPIDFIIIEDTAIPVFRSQDFAGRIETGDYDGSVGRARYYTYEIGDITLVPTYNPRIERVDYFSITNGEYWINQYRDTAVNTMTPENRTRDNLGVAWTRQRNLTGQAITPATLKKKRKLRRKYKTMPQIRDEKHYAGQEFIA